MVLLVTLTVGLVWWVSAWSLGVKSFDAFMITLALLVGAATWHVAAPFVRKFLGGPRADA